MCVCMYICIHICMYVSMCMQVCISNSGWLIYYKIEPLKSNLYNYYKFPIFSPFCLIFIN